MTNMTAARRRRRFAIEERVICFWQAFTLRRWQIKQQRIVDELDDHLRRDIGLPPRGQRSPFIETNW